MLTYLHIRDLAIVDAAEIEFGAGFTVLSGETGAGKSIVIDALQLVCGGRAGVEIVRHGAERAEVAATFEAAHAPKALSALLEEHGIEISDELVVRRVVTAEGKSRTWLNGQSVTIQLLKQVGEMLLDIHGQQEFQALARNSSQRDLLDEFGGHGQSTAAVALLHQQCARTASGLRERETAFAEADARLALLSFQVQEVSGLKLQPGEAQELLAESSRLANRGKLAESARTALALLYEAEDANAHALTSRALTQLRQAANLDAKLCSTIPMVDEAQIRIAEAAREVSAYLDALDVDPGRQEFVEQRLAAIESLARKHRVAPKELTSRLDELVRELADLQRGESDLAALRSELQRGVAQWRLAAGMLGKLRTAAAKKLSRDVTHRMQGLGMVGGRFEISLAPSVLANDATSATGLESVEFLVSANPGQPPRPIGKVASGGELSRLSLAVQVALVSRGEQGGVARCMVFDEIDAGVGGAVAEIVGRELATLAQRVQVLCVTHLPQVASQAGNQLRVSKLNDGQLTRTQIKKLTPEERIEETARMLGGIAVTAKAREHALEMLGPRAEKSTAGSSPARERRRTKMS